MWQSIISSFENLTPLLWVSQICGIIGFILICISYQFDRKRFLLISSFSLFHLVCFDHDESRISSISPSAFTEKEIASTILL